MPRAHLTTYDERAARFTACALAASATVVRAVTVNDVADAIADYLAAMNLPPVVHLSAEPPGLSPGNNGRLRCEVGPPRPDGDVVVSGCFAAIADEGVIVMASGPGHAPESVMLAATHVAVVGAAQMVDSLEALWARLRDAGDPPRLINLILGPSRTADLGLPSRLGAHGPLRVHVILIEERADMTTP
jgi:L-lactate dehydrogenase complex protein LldG